MSSARAKREPDEIIENTRAATSSVGSKPKPRVHAETDRALGQTFRIGTMFRSGTRASQNRVIPRDARVACDLRLGVD